MNISSEEKLLSRITGYQMVATIEALENAGASEKLLRLIRSDRDVATAMVSLGNELLRKRGIFSDYELARAILGKDFIAPDEISNVLDLQYSNKVFGRYTKSIPSEDLLLWLKKNNFSLIAGPPCELEASEIVNLNYKLFNRGDNFFWQWEGYRADLVREEKLQVRWLMIRKKHISRSLGCSYKNMPKLISDLEYIPSVAEVIWELFIYKVIRNVWLRRNLRTAVRINGSDILYGDPCTNIRSSNENGIELDHPSQPDGYSDDLGISPARKQ
ncbi:MAG: hypothetical protein PHF35_03885 [Candidatus Moranbacteria bacterium]|nr:hypothetical protein [Candidatus Moranbacteria bacterium]